MNPKMLISKRISCIGTVLVLILTLSFSAFAQGNEAFQAVAKMVTDAKEKVGSVTVEELAKKMAGNEKMVVLDIRTEAEYKAGHLEGALWIPRGKLEFMAGGMLPDPNAEIITYCRVDSRSALAAATLKDMGYKNARYLKGGFMFWVKEGHPIFNQHGELTVKEFEKKEKQK
jgi:rhodanese-related sulfurtransferase